MGPFSRFDPRADALLHVTSGITPAPAPLCTPMEALDAVSRHATVARPPRRWMRRAAFWLRRYLPAEAAGTLTMLAAGIAVAGLSVPAVVIGIVASQAESVGFYAVAGIAVWREQRRVAPSRGRLRSLLKVLLLLVLEFGPAELLDTLLVRPLFMTIAVLAIPDLGWALVAGKIAADVVFYVLAATAFRVTEKTGARGVEEAPASIPERQPG